VGLVLGIGGSRGCEGSERDRAKWYCVGLVLVIGESRGGGETAERETERDGIVWDWYWLLGRAGVGVRQQRERQSEMVLCGTGTGY